VDLKDGNYLHYGIIAKREEDRIEEEKEIEELFEKRKEKMNK